MHHYRKVKVDLMALWGERIEDLSIALASNLTIAGVFSFPGSSHYNIIGSTGV